MYFIPRNNAIYSYIAHTNAKRRYCATLFVLLALIIISFYGIYIPLNSHILLYKAEIARLQTQYQEMSQLKKQSDEVSSLIATSKKNINDAAIETDKKEDYCNKHMLYILDAIQQKGLILDTYGSCKEMDKQWFSRYSAHFEITGSYEKIISFFKTIQDSKKMIDFSSTAISRLNDDAFKLSCDVGIVAVKKSLLL